MSITKLWSPSLHPCSRLQLEEAAPNAIVSAMSSHSTCVPLPHQPPPSLLLSSCCSIRLISDSVFWIFVCDCFRYFGWFVVVERGEVWTVAGGGVVHSNGGGVRERSRERELWERRGCEIKDGGWKKSPPRGSKEGLRVRNTA